jgi:hypothetical protein
MLKKLVSKATGVPVVPKVCVCFEYDASGNLNADKITIDKIPVKIEDNQVVAKDEAGTTTLAKLPVFKVDKVKEALAQPIVQDAETTTNVVSADTTNVVSATTPTDEATVTTNTESANPLGTTSSTNAITSEESTENISNNFPEQSSEFSGVNPMNRTGGSRKASTKKYKHQKSQGGRKHFKGGKRQTKKYRRHTKKVVADKVV